MESVTIHGREVGVGYAVGVGGAPLDPATLHAGLTSAVGLINATSGWSEDELEAFAAVRKIVFFSGTIEVNTWKLSRPGCDEDDAIFYWQAGEFLANPDDDVRANTLFHDCWHIVQFRRAGNKFARDDDERLEREVDAILRQIAVAERLSCSEAEIAHLRKYINDNALIVARLGQGVLRMDHGPIDRGQA